MKKIYIAADGGGTKLDMAALSERGDVLARVRVNRGINRKTVSEDAVRATVAEAYGMLKEQIPDLTAEKCVGYIMHNTDVFTEVLCCESTEVDEGTVGLYAAGIYGDGALILSGTGADAYIIKNGAVAGIVGGYGAMLGDDGSGFAIGRAAINAAIASYEGRGGKTLLEELIIKKYPAETFRKSVYGIYATPETARNIADFCKECEEAADLGDKTAKDIFKKAAFDLASYAYAGYDKYELDPAAPFTFAGGVILHDLKREKPLMFPYILSALKDHGITNFIMPDKRPIEGAIEYIKRNIL